ncbi:LapD/MoxY N-terminal periplasmic domain-containing protein [Thiomicrospira sp. ALE5]|uniref:bifunctional diguanylate cyclase/phosphodiesterase n=1 Tax=Thiomicrospira sp. ALE5 TaxID=748650 RepID=UPI0008DFDC96|nr:LapD/MoxY N-terminal periplasmic domain-containing protein [Thiomicrospira sp. ALE5]SFR56947.1 diguanylate cyclase/phosphodiesterase [Thiomicrospira sp. ALE5]
MSLIKQLWLGIIGLLLIAFISSFFVSVYNAKSYFEDQLNLKNNDNAQSLALSLSQMDKEPVMVELFIAAQFDTGYYRRIELIDPMDETIQRRIFDDQESITIPEWFEDLIALDIQPGIALVQDGWQQYGTVYVESHDRFAYEALWQSTLQLSIWLSIIALVSGLVGTFLLKTIIKPLDFVVEQAEAMGDRRFLVGDEPRTLEFGRVVRAMNKLSKRIKAMLERESQRLSTLRASIAVDHTTGCLNRDYIISQLDAILADRENTAAHGVLLIRAKGLQECNQKLGRQQVDHELKHLVNEVARDLGLISASKECVGRLNGTDFVVLLPDELNDQQAWCQALREKLDGEKINYAMAFTSFSCIEARGHLLARLDSLLVRAEQQSNTALEMLSGSESSVAHLPVLTESDWSQCIQQALNPLTGLSALKFAYFPTQDAQSKIWHQEAMMRLDCQNQTFTAWQILPWAKRFKQVAELDEKVLEKALVALAEDVDLKLAVNISITTIAIESVRTRLLQQLNQSQNLASRLALEFTEQEFMAQQASASAALLLIKQTGCKIGIEKAGSNILKTPNIQELGLDYLKINSVFVREFITSQNDRYLRGIMTLAHTLGIIVIAEGVMAEAEIAQLIELGFDGVTGPGVA